MDRDHDLSRNLRRLRNRRKYQC